MKASMKRVLAFVFCLVLLAPLMMSAFISNVQIPAKAATATQNQKNIAARADYL